MFRRWCFTLWLIPVTGAQLVSCQCTADGAVEQWCLGDFSVGFAGVIALLFWGCLNRLNARTVLGPGLEVLQFNKLYL